MVTTRRHPTAEDVELSPSLTQTPLTFLLPHVIDVHARFGAVYVTSGLGAGDWRYRAAQRPASPSSPESKLESRQACPPRLCYCHGCNSHMYAEHAEVPRTLLGSL